LDKYSTIAESSVGTGIANIYTSFQIESISHLQKKHLEANLITVTHTTNSHLQSKIKEEEKEKKGKEKK
jgi:hypothetical protein